MNKVILIGNLTRAPEMSTTTSGKNVARFTLAVTRNYSNADGEKEVDFINIVTWGNIAENCGKYLDKGRKVAIVGEVRNRSYNAQDGSKRYVTEVLANEVEFIGYKQGKEDEEEATLTPIDDNDLPF